MFLDSITLTKTLPCLAEPGKIIVIGKPNCPLNEVIPFLAALPGVIAYNPETLTLTFRRNPGFMTLGPDKVSIIQVKDIEEGLMLLNALTDAVNATWEHRAELTAVNNSRRAPRLLDLWALLPQTNCKKCEEESCLAFAAGLLMQKREVTECVTLQMDSYTDRREALEAML